jgi:XTP/dITP diphosphohydrolase
MNKLIFATGNKGKLKEVKQIFSDTPFQIVAPFELGNEIEVDETESTFEGNAFLKAKAIFDVYKKPVIADDSGLEVEALNGAPGVYSARYAGENCTFDDNNEKLLGALSDKSFSRFARFVSCAVYYDGENRIVENGFLNGTISHEKRGEHGFGYDPIFIPENSERVLAEYTIDEKNKISHRFRAFESLKKRLEEIT